MVGAELSDKGKKIVLNPEVTIYNVKQVRERLAEEIRNETNLTIDLSKVVSMDTAGFQLLISIKKTAQIKNKTVVFASHSEEVLKFIDLYGVAGLFGDWLQLDEENKKNFEFKYGMKASRF